MNYSRHTIAVESHIDFPGILQKISGLPGVVVVNIALPGDADALLFCEENLNAVLAGAPGEIVLEALPRGEFMTLVREKTGQVIQDLQLLRSELRTSYAADLAARVTEFLRRLEEVRLMLGCWNLQKALPDATENVGTLQSLGAQLAASSLEQGDNIRCMDDLQYVIRPALEAIKSKFGGM